MEIVIAMLLVVIIVLAVVVNIYGYRTMYKCCTNVSVNVMYFE